MFYKLISGQRYRVIDRYIIRKMKSIIFKIKIIDEIITNTTSNQRYIDHEFDVFLHTIQIVNDK